MRGAEAHKREKCMGVRDARGISEKCMGKKDARGISEKCMGVRGAEVHKR